MCPSFKNVLSKISFNVIPTITNAISENLHSSNTKWLPIMTYIHSYADDSPFSHSPCIERIKHLLIWFLCFIETSTNNLMSQKFVFIIFYRSRFVLKIENLVSRILIGSNQNISSVIICCLSTIKHTDWESRLMSYSWRLTR